VTAFPRGKTAMSASTSCRQRPRGGRSAWAWT
jgi:hypothetical protein